MSDAVVAQKSPYAVEITSGENYAWCRCGQSAKQPFCDGAHKETEFRPVVFTAEETKTVYFCGCKQTGNQPYCDGSHKAL